MATINNLPTGATGLELAAVSAGGEFQHFNSKPDGKFEVFFPRNSMVRVWAYFSLNGASYAAPLNHYVGIVGSSE